MTFFRRFFGSPSPPRVRSRAHGRPVQPRVQTPDLDADAWADIADQVGDAAKDALLDKLAPDRVPTDSEVRAASMFSRMVREAVSRIGFIVQGGTA